MATSVVSNKLCILCDEICVRDFQVQEQIDVQRFCFVSKFHADSKPNSSHFDILN